VFSTFEHELKPGEVRAWYDAHPCKPPGILSLCELEIKCDLPLCRGLARLLSFGGLVPSYQLAVVRFTPVTNLKST
jgi:hypothetical protein